MENIIFLFSLPRSGSTLLQKLLMTHHEIHSVSEPWLLLPLVYPLKLKGVLTDYDSITCNKAIIDFIKELPEKEQDYYNAVQQFAFILYKKTTEKKVKYFLDKTPRYYNIIPEIMKIFPDAKFIFLFRNPLAVLSSIFETWHNGKLMLKNNYRDVYRGPELLAKGYKSLEGRSIKVNYENLINKTEIELKKIFNYLEIAPDNNSKNNFYFQNLKGEMGDKNTAKEIRKDYNEKWKFFYSTRMRQKYAKKYLNYLGPDLLETFGYNSHEIIKELKPPKFNYILFVSDRYNMYKEKIIYFIFKSKILKKIFPFFIYHDK